MVERKEVAFIYIYVVMKQEKWRFYGILGLLSAAEQRRPTRK